jgi:hypothetical protein
MSLQEHIKKVVSAYTLANAEYRIRYELDDNTLVVSTDGCSEHFEIDLLCPTTIKVYSVSKYETSGDDGILDVGSQLLDVVYIDVC